MRDVDKFKRNMRISLGIFVTLFSVLIIYLGYSVVVYGNQWYATPYNPRIQQAYKNISGGTVYDAKGIRLAWSDGTTRRYHEEVDKRRALSHIMGDPAGIAAKGVETRFAKYLYGMDKDLVERIEDLLAGKESQGNDITLTVDAELSEYIYDNMDAKTGCIVVLNYKTGEILANVSIPTFDPTTLGKEEPVDTSLVDRATMGRYPPGSIMKIITASAAMEEGIDLSYECTGECIIEGQKVTCSGGAHGALTLESAFTKSCNTYFANLSVKIGGSRLKKQAEKFGFNQQFKFAGDEIELYPSNFEVTGNEGDVAWAGVGQYNDLVTPLHAAMIAGSIANDGVMMEPKLLRDVARGGYAGFSFTPTQYKRVLSAEMAGRLKEYMREVVQSGTGTSAGVSGVPICGKTGTAEFMEDGQVKNHSWFVGFIDDNSKPYAVAVIFEGAGFGSRYAAPMAGKIFGYLANH